MKLDISGANFNTKPSAGNWMEAFISFFRNGPGLLIYHLNPAFKVPIHKTGEKSHCDYNQGTTSVYPVEQVLH